MTAEHGDRDERLYAAQREGNMRDVTESGTLRNFTIEDTRGLRYAELAMIGPDLITIYKSTGLSQAPPDEWDALDTQEIAERYQLKAVFKNGPH